MDLSSSEIEFIQEAALFLESPGFTLRVSRLLGKPIEIGLELLPKAVRDQLAVGSQRALQGCLKAALLTLGPDSPGSTRGRAYSHELEWIGDRSDLEPGFARFRLKMASAVAGAVGGALGLPGLALELPLSTVLIFRGIASIARRSGLDLSLRENQLDCLNVLAMGYPGEKTGDPGAQSIYFTERLALAQLVSDAMVFLGRVTVDELAEAVTKGSAPALVRLIARLVARFELLAGEKAMAQLVPLLGAASGAAINAAFAGHFNSVAQYHFGILRLERRYGAPAVRQVYEREIRA